MRCLGVAPDAPNAIMWLDIAEAPAEVPATTAPWRKRSRIASARRVPPIVEDSRSWLPPVRKMPVASRTARAAVVVVRLGPGDRVEQRDPRDPELARRPALYRSPASSPSDEAVEITAIVASTPPASATNRLRMTRSRTLSSAPPMMMTVPSVTSSTCFGVGWR